MTMQVVTIFLSVLLVSWTLVEYSNLAYAVETCNGLVATIVSTTDADVIFDTTGDDVIVATGLHVTVKAIKGGNDTICTADGNDAIILKKGSIYYVNAGNGDNNITGDTGDDTIIAGNGNNIINAGYGNNDIVVGDGDHDIAVGEGNDTITVGNGMSLINVVGGNNNITACVGVHTINTGPGDDVIQASSESTVDAGAGTDSVTTCSSNNPPTAVNDSVEVDELDTVIFNATSNDSDTDGTLDKGTLTITGSGPTNGGATYNGDGTITYTHTKTGTTTDSFKYTIDDNSGDTSNEATVTITINASTSGDNDPIPAPTPEEQAKNKDKKTKEQRKNDILTKKREKQETMQKNPNFAKGLLNSNISELAETYFEQRENSDDANLGRIVSESKKDKSNTAFDNNPAEQQNQLNKKKDSVKDKKVNRSEMEKAAKELGLQYKNGQTKIVIELSDDNPEALEKIQELGKIDLKSNKHVQVTVNLDKISKIRSISGIEKVRPPAPAIQQVEYSMSGVTSSNDPLVRVDESMSEFTLANESGLETTSFEDSSFFVWAKTIISCLVKLGCYVTNFL